VKVMGRRRRRRRRRRRSILIVALCRHCHKYGN
jgi:hypothetical protein